MNRFQVRFLVVLAGLLLADVLLAATVALVQGSGFVGTARIAIGLTGIGLLIVAAFMSGGIRSRSQAARTAHLPIVPSAQEAVLSEWRQEGLVSEVSDVALIYGGILTAVGALLYVVPGA